MELTRRKILASVGAVGAAGAAAGLGTSALFSDTEEFSNNTMVAGELDLKMDWEEHYSFPQIYSDFSDPTVENGNSLDVVRSEPDDTTDYVGLPDPQDPVVWVNDSDSPTGGSESSLDLYFENTTIEAFPDRNDNADNPKGTFTQIAENNNNQPIVQTPCEMLADVPQPGLSTYNDDTLSNNVNYQDPGRSANKDTYNSQSGEYKSLINLTDVKPGDFGEFTFSAHLCDNDGYLWLQMPGGLDNDDNGLTGPEEDFGNDSTGGEDQGELAQNTQVVLWDDDCDNILDTDANDLVALAIIDTSDSNQSELVDVVSAANQFVVDLYEAQDGNDLDIQAGIITFEDTSDSNDPLVAAPIQDISNYVTTGGGNTTGNFGGGTYIENSGGNSPLAHALDTGRAYLNDKANALSNDTTNDITDPDKEILLLSDGQPSYGFGGFGSSGVNRGTLKEEDNSGNIVDFSGPSGTYTSDFFDGDPNDSDLKVPNPNTATSGKARAEVAIVARDIDGDPLYPGVSSADPSPNDPRSQDDAAKVDKPKQDGDDPGISGDDGITIRAVVTYPSGDSTPVRQGKRDTMMAYSTGTGSGNFYDLQQAGTPGGLGSTIALDILGEDVLFRGTLNELEAELPMKLEGPSSDSDCFPAGATHCFGLGWWVPEDVGNVIQSDSVSFDLGFYTEQCRNNPNPDGP